MVSVNSLEDGKLFERENGIEDWERDLVKVVFWSSFILKCIIFVFLSLVFDDLLYIYLEKNKIGVEFLIGKVKFERIYFLYKFEGEYFLFEM